MVKIIGGRKYYPLPEAAKLVGVTHTTMWRWARGRTPTPGFKLHVLRDRMSGHLYIETGSVIALAKRFQPIPIEGVSGVD